MKQRLGFVDIAKALAVLFIIVGHTGLVFSSDMVAGGMPSWVERFAFTFHLPVFFILSGYFLNLEQPLTCAFVRKCARSLLVPYVLTCALIIVACAFSALVTASPQMAASEALRWFQASLWGAGATTDVALWHVERIGGVWFLLALFWARLIIAATSGSSHAERWIIVLACMAVGIWSGQYVWLPLSIQSGMGCAAYVMLGAYVRRAGMFGRKLSPAFWVTCVTLWIMVAVWGGRASLAMGVYPLGALDVLGGVAAAFCVVAASRAIETHAVPLNRFLQWIGRNTLPIFALHILEDNVLSWGTWGARLATLTDGAWWTWIALLVVRLLLDAALVGLAYVVPGVRRVYFPQLAKRG